MHHSWGLAALLAFLIVVAAFVEEAGKDEREVQDFYSPQERRAHERLKAAADHPTESPEHQSILDEVEASLVKLYDEGRGQLTEDSLLVLGDLTQRDLRGASHEDMMNKAGIYYEDAFEKHNSTEGYFQLAKIIETLGKKQGIAGNSAEQEHRLDQANKMFLVCGAKGHPDAMRRLVANCESNLGFGPEGCPHEVKYQAREFHEQLLTQSPDDPLILGKLAIFWAQGFGVKQPDLPTACTYAEKAAQANAAILEAGERTATKKLDEKDYEVLGYNTNNYILHGNCKYFSDFRSHGDHSERTEGRKILKVGLERRQLRDADFKQLEDHLMSMVGPEEEPTYSGFIEWHDALKDELGDKWFGYIWSSLSKGFFWSPRLRLGDVSLTIKQKGDGLVDFSSDDPHLWLEATKFEPSSHGRPGQLHGKARRQTGEGSFLEGTFMFTAVSHGPRSEL